MPDDLRTRIANAAGDFLSDNFHAYLEQDIALELADAVIRELPELTALRRCGRCRRPCRPDEYPPMHEGSDELRPFCMHCSDYIEWATS